MGHSSCGNGIAIVASPGIVIYTPWSPSRAPQPGAPAPHVHRQTRGTRAPLLRSVPAFAPITAPACHFSPYPSRDPTLARCGFTLTRRRGPSAGAPAPHSRLETWPTLAPLFAPSLGHRRPTLPHRALLPTSGPRPGSLRGHRAPVDRDDGSGSCRDGLDLALSVRDAEGDQ